jgi:hypothetical protein
MSVDLAAAERFMYESARLLDRHRSAVLLHGAPTEPVTAALRAYRNPDGGFGHGLEPDVRGPFSEPVSTLDALEVLLEIDGTDDPMVGDAVAWLASIAFADGSITMASAGAAAFPHAPWMVPSEGGSHLTFMLAAALSEAAVSDPWLERACDWCWERIESAAGLSGYWIKAGLGFLDGVGDEQRAMAAIARIGEELDADGSIRVPGGTENERLRPLTLSPRPGLRSRTLFTAAQIDAELDAVESGQQKDGGWTFDFLAWSPGQELDWRGGVTLGALRTLRLHDRI